MLTLLIINSLLSPTFLDFQKQTIIKQNFGGLTRCFLVNAKGKNLFTFSVMDARGKRAEHKSVRVALCAAESNFSFLSAL